MVLGIILYINYFSLKAKTPKNLLSNVVDKFSCQNDSELSYIGETKRHLVIRSEEHLDLDNSKKIQRLKLISKAADIVKIMLTPLKLLKNVLTVLTP